MKTCPPCLQVTADAAHYANVAGHDADVASNVRTGTDLYRSRCDPCMVFDWGFQLDGSGRRIKASRDPCGNPYRATDERCAAADGGRDIDITAGGEKVAAHRLGDPERAARDEAVLVELPVDIARLPVPLLRMQRGDQKRDDKRHGKDRQRTQHSRAIS